MTNDVEVQADDVEDIGEIEVRDTSVLNLVYAPCMPVPFAN